MSIILSIIRGSNSLALKHSKANRLEKSIKGYSIMFIHWIVLLKLLIIPQVLFLFAWLMCSISNSYGGISNSTIAKLTLGTYIYVIDTLFLVGYSSTRWILPSKSNGVWWVYYYMEWNTSWCHSRSSLYRTWIEWSD